MDTDTPIAPSPPASRLPVGWLLILGLGALLALSVAKSFFPPPADAHPAVGRILSRLDVVPLAGDAPTVTAESLRGKVILVNYWATRCGPCRAELPHISQLYQEFRGRDDFVLLSISTDEEPLASLAPKASRLLDDLDAQMPVHWDATGSAFEAFVAAGGQPGIPATVLLDRQGRIRAVWQGYRPGLEQEVRTVIEQLLAASPAG